MKSLCKVLAIVAGVLVAGYLVAEDSPKKQARVTRIIRDVKVLPSGSPARPAALDEMVRENTGVRTGAESRSELTFADLTITRLGANTVFNFSRAGRSAELGNGSMLLRIPKDSGGATIRTSAITVGITGTTVIFEGNRSGRSKLIVLEGDASVRLVDHPKEFKRVLAGQMLDVKAGATTLPDPVTLDLRQIMKSHPLITDFPPLPSEDLIVAVMRNQQSSAGNGERVYSASPVTGQPVSGQPASYSPPLIGGGAVFPLPGGRVPHPTRGTGSRGSAGSKSTPAPTTYLPGKPSPKRPVGRASPTPTPPTIY
jgi:FecR protein